MANSGDLTGVAAVSAPAEIAALVEKFAEHRETYRRTGYNETQLRQDFLDPLFIALGWDPTAGFLASTKNFGTGPMRIQ